MVKFHKDFLVQQLGLPDAAIKDDIVETSRWSVHHEIIFANDGKFYRTWYSVGATEMQMEYPWENDQEVECHEVELIEKLVKVWENKK